MRFTGVGGQGVLLAGEIFAAAKIKMGGYGVKTATYTSQVRGGPTVVDIQLDDKEIFYPYAIKMVLPKAVSLLSIQIWSIRRMKIEKNGKSSRYRSLRLRRKRLET